MPLRTTIGRSDLRHRQRGRRREIEPWLSPICSPAGARTIPTADSSARGRPCASDQGARRNFSPASARGRSRVLLDLGPVVGTNVTFFGEQLGCKIFVEDLSKDIDRHVREDKIAELPAFFEKRFPQDAESFDGILCWDVFDYLDKRRRCRWRAQLTRLLRPDGVLLAFFSTAEPQPGDRPPPTRGTSSSITRTLQHRPYPAARGKQRPLLNRDIQRMFEPLRITEQFLLKTNMREVLFRKSAAAAWLSRLHDRTST